MSGDMLSEVEQELQTLPESQQVEKVKIVTVSVHEFWKRGYRISGHLNDPPAAQLEAWGKAKGFETYPDPVKGTVTFLNSTRKTSAPEIPTSATENKAPGVPDPLPGGAWLAVFCVYHHADCSEHASQEEAEASLRSGEEAGACYGVATYHVPTRTLHMRDPLDMSDADKVRQTIEAWLDKASQVRQ
jgi:hypothetical protein